LILKEGQVKILNRVTWWSQKKENLFLLKELQKWGNNL
jgi:hypothetical protein